MEVLVTSARSDTQFERVVVDFGVNCVLRCVLIFSERIPRKQLLALAVFAEKEYPISAAVPEVRRLVRSVA